MKYWLHVYTPETWGKFLDFGGCVTGFGERYAALAEEIKVGDRFVCYVARLTAWSAVLTVESSAYRDRSPLFGEFLDDQYVVRFKVTPLVLLETEIAIDVLDLWADLDRTRDHVYGEKGWPYKARLVKSPMSMTNADGDTITAALKLKKTASTQT